MVGHLPSMHKALPSRLSTRERKVSTIKLILLEGFQRESPFGYSEGKKKLPIQSGIWDVLCRCLQLKLTKGSQPAFDYSNRLPLLRIAQLVSKAGVGLTF